MSDCVQIKTPPIQERRLQRMARPEKGQLRLPKRDREAIAWALEQVAALNVAREHVYQLQDALEVAKTILALDVTQSEKLDDKLMAKANVTDRLEFLIASSRSQFPKV